MDKLTQDAYWRQRMMLFCEQHGLTQTSLRYHVSRPCVWKWQGRWDVGTGAGKASWIEAGVRTTARASKAIAKKNW